MEQKLPKLEVHFGNEVLHVPQNKRLNIVMFAFYKDTLKENILESYVYRVMEAKKEKGEACNFKDITLKDAETQIVEDLKQYGDEFVFEKVWMVAEGKIEADTLMVSNAWLSDEEEVFDRKVEELENDDLER